MIYTPGATPEKNRKSATLAIDATPCISLEFIGFRVNSLKIFRKSPAGLTPRDPPIRPFLSESLGHLDLRRKVLRIFRTS